MLTQNPWAWAWVWAPNVWLWSAHQSYLAKNVSFSQPVMWFVTFKINILNHGHYLPNGSNPLLWNDKSQMSRHSSVGSDKHWTDQNFLHIANAIYDKHGLCHSAQWIQNNWLMDSNTLNPILDLGSKPLAFQSAPTQLIEEIKLTKKMKTLLQVRRKTHPLKMIFLEPRPTHKKKSGQARYA